MPKYLYKSKGFSVIELLVAIAVIVIISAIVIPNYKNINRKYALDRAAYKLARDLRGVQEMAMAMVDVSGSIGDRYGIQLSQSLNSYYVIFSDEDDNGRYNSGDREIKKIYYGNGVITNKLTLDEAGAGTQQTTSTITFRPSGTTTEIIGQISSASTTSNWSFVRLISSYNNNTRDIIINGAGLIYVK